jgi:hypothetical protein
MAKSKKMKLPINEVLKEYDKANLEIPEDIIADFGKRADKIFAEKIKIFDSFGLGKKSQTQLVQLDLMIQFDVTIGSFFQLIRISLKFN